MIALSSMTISFGADAFLFAAIACFKTFEEMLLVLYIHSPVYRQNAGGNRGG